MCLRGGGGGSGGHTRLFFARRFVETRAKISAKRRAASFITSCFNDFLICARRVRFVAPRTHTAHAKGMKTKTKAKKKNVRTHKFHYDFIIAAEAR